MTRKWKYFGMKGEYLPLSGGTQGPVCVSAVKGASQVPRIAVSL